MDPEMYSTEGEVALEEEETF